MVAWVACDRKLRNPPAAFDHADVPTIDIEAEVISEADVLGLPSDIIVVGNFVVVSDQAGQPFLHVFDGRDGSLLTSFGRKGGGPGEFKMAPKLMRIPGTPNRLAVLDVGLGRLTEFDLRDPPASLAEPVVTPLNLDKLVYEMQLLRDGQAVGLGLFEEGRIAFLNLQTGRVRFSGSAPTPREGEEALPPGFIQYAYQANLAVSPDGGIIVAALRRGSTLEFFDSAGSVLESREGPYTFPVDFVVDGGSGDQAYRAGEMNRYGYVDLDAAESGIWGLFSGRSEEAYGNDSWLAEYIHHFSWDGDFVRAFHLSRPLVAVGIDDEESTIFGVATDPSPALVRIVVPTPINSPADPTVVDN